MTVFTEGKHTAEFILSEGNGSISREEVTIDAAAGAMAAGTVVAKLANGKYTAYNNAGSGGAEIAAGVLYRAVPNLTVDQDAVIIARSAEVVGAELTGLDAAGKADLAALGIIVR